MDIFPTSIGESNYEGLVKLRLAHAQGFSIVIPDAVFLDIDGWKWFQPHFFSACILGYLDDQAQGRLNIDTDTGASLLIDFTKEGFVRRYANGAQLFRCRISGPKNLERFASGTCVHEENGSILLRLFHHTSPKAYKLISECKYFLGSKWNIQGNKRLSNVDYVYFTSLPKIRCEDDLMRIAMSSQGVIALLPTNGFFPDDLVSVKVYRETTNNRRTTLSKLVPVEIIAPYHVWRHAPFRQAVYYEVSHKAIFRVGLQPGTILPFSDDRVIPSEPDLKRFDYVVLGDADDPKVGLLAPYDEENTPAVFKLDGCKASGNLFDAWCRHANTDQFTGLHAEPQHFVSD